MHWHAVVAPGERGAWGRVDRVGLGLAVVVRGLEVAGLAPKDNSVIYLLLSVFGMSVVAAAIAQSELNRIWEHA